ncbi:hypothetical protein HDV05_000796 [Chytridiales sp. JEL 0842]|nr:hypothetical protein HDV05_000796 [Chytridiales sp. JEL 0842]
MKTLLITGATSGLGLETAKKLVKSGHKVIIASRNEAKVAQTCNDICQECNVDQGAVIGKVLDTSSLQSVKSFLDDLRTSELKVDTLILNAGMVPGPLDGLQISPDGFELTFATNQLGHFYLTESLIPDIRSGRIIVVSSGTHDPSNHTLTPTPFFDPESWAKPDKAKFDLQIAYPNSKLANAVYGKELARRLQKAGNAITVAIYDPGFISTTGLLRGLGLLQLIVPTVIGLGLRFTSWWYGSPNQVASMPVSSAFLAKLAVDDVLMKESGNYYSVDQVQKCNPIAEDAGNQQMLTEFCRRFILDSGFELP